MYLPFFGLSEKPFAITPDPRYLFLGERHAEALAHLVYGITEAGGFVQLTGEVGTGKTTIIRSLLARQPDNAEIALILNPGMNAPEFLLTICEELGIMVPNDAIGSVKDLVDILNHYLLKAHAQGKRVVLVVDEAQNLSPELLEQVRLLTNLETDTQKLLQIILIGQPELRDLLARNDLRQLAQRVTGRYHLDPLSRSEAAAYVKHRLRIAGATADIFTGSALAELYRCSGGVPRLLNIISDRALLGGYTEDRHEITATMVRRAASEVFDRRITPHWLPWVLGAATLVVVVGGALAAWSLYRARARCRAIAARWRPSPKPAAAAAPPPPCSRRCRAAPVELATLLRDSAAHDRTRRRLHAAVCAVVGPLHGRLGGRLFAGTAPGPRVPQRGRRLRSVAALQSPGHPAGVGRERHRAPGGGHEADAGHGAADDRRRHARGCADRPGAALARGLPAAVETAAAGYAQPLA